DRDERPEGLGLDPRRRHRRPGDGHLRHGRLSRGLRIQPRASAARRARRRPDDQQRPHQCQQRADAADPPGRVIAGAAAAFRDELLSAGLLVATSVDGLYGRSATFEAIVDGVERLATAAGADHDATVVRFPPVIPRTVFERTDYLRSFPDLTGSIHTFRGDDKAHAELLRLL